MSITAPDPAQLARTGRAITAGIWVCAVITMAASVLNGTSVFAELTNGAMGMAHGLLTALAVDACLVMVLCGDRQMQALGLSATWGRVLRWTTLGMSLALNCGTALLGDHYFLAGLYAIPPLLIVGMSEYGQEVMLQFTAELRRRESARLVAEKKVRDERQAAIDAENAKTRRIAEEEDARRRREAHQRTLTAEAERTAQFNQLAADEAARLREETERRAEAAREALTTRRPRLTVVGNGSGKPSRKATTTASPGQCAQDWLRARHDAGEDYTQIGPRQIADELGIKYETCKSSHQRWKAAVAEKLQLIADLEEAAG